MNLTHRASDEKTKITNYFTFIENNQYTFVINQKNFVLLHFFRDDYLDGYELNEDHESECYDDQNSGEFNFQLML